MMRANLGGDGPVSAMDGAWALVRSSGWRGVVMPMAGGALASGPVLLAFYFERVEGVRSLRPLLAFALVLGLWGRALLAAPAARRAIEGLWPSLPIAEEGGRAIDVVRTASVVCLGLFIYLFVLATASLITPIMSLVLLPILVLRGLVAPSWIARAGVSTEGGLLVFARAAGDSTGRRVRGALVELLLLVGTAGLALNLYLLMVVGLLLLRSLLGLDLASVDAFLSLRNPFVGASIVALAFILLEPLRVALSAFTYVDAQVRREGLDLAAAIDDAVRAAERRGARGPSARGGMAAVVLFSFLALPAGAQAQPESDPPMSTVGETDEEVRREVAEILRRPEFIEHEDPDGRGIDALIRQLLEWLIAQGQQQNMNLEPAFALPMPPTWLFIVLGLFLLLLVVVYLVVMRGKRRAPKKARDGPAEEGAIDPRERAPEAHLDDAALLARDGRFRDALRSLYLATLVALDRRRVITFDPSRTNWHYLRQLPRDDRRADFSRFTRLFDHKWYGEEATTEDDYRECRALADRIVAEAGGT